MTKAPAPKARGSKGGFRYKKSSAAPVRRGPSDARASRSRTLLKKRVRAVETRLNKLWFDMYGLTDEEE